MLMPPASPARRPGAATPASRSRRNGTKRKKIKKEEKRNKVFYE